MCTTALSSKIVVFSLEQWCSGLAARSLGCDIGTGVSNHFFLSLLYFFTVRFNLYKAQGLLKVESYVNR